MEILYYTQYIISWFYHIAIQKHFKVDCEPTSVANGSSQKPICSGALCTFPFDKRARCWLPICLNLSRQIRFRDGACSTPPTRSPTIFPITANCKLRSGCINPTVASANATARACIKNYPSSEKNIKHGWTEMIGSEKIQNNASTSGFGKSRTTIPRSINIRSCG